MSHIYIELLEDSRQVKMTQTSIEETILAALCLDDTITTDTLNAEFMGSDEDVIAAEFMYSIFPIIRFFPDFSGQIRVLVMKDLELSYEARVWKAKVTYSYDLKTGTGGSEANEDGVLPYIKYSFSIGGGTKNVVKGEEFRNPPVLATNSPLPEVPKNDLIAIGRTDDSIEGVQVPNSELLLQITAYFLPTTITLDFLWTLRDLIAGAKNKGSYNNDVYFGAEIGEVQLTDISGGGTVVDIIPLTFSFHLAKNLNDVEDEGFPNLTALGHDIIDYFFLHEFDEEDSKKVILQPTARYVIRVAEPEDYSKLKIPGAVEDND